MDKVGLKVHGEMMERKIEVKVPNSVDPQSIACGINRQYGDHGVVARVVEPGSSGKFTAREENSVFVSPAEMHQMTDQEKREYVELFNTIPATELGIILDM